MGKMNILAKIWVRTYRWKSVLKYSGLKQKFCVGEE